MAVSGRRSEIVAEAGHHADSAEVEFLQPVVEDDIVLFLEHADVEVELDADAQPRGDEVVDTASDEQAQTTTAVEILDVVVGVAEADVDVVEPSQVVREAAGEADGGRQAVEAIIAQTAVFSCAMGVGETETEAVGHHVGIADQELGADMHAIVADGGLQLVGIEGHTTAQTDSVGRGLGLDDLLVETLLVGQR